MRTARSIVATATFLAVASVTGCSGGGGSAAPAPTSVAGGQAANLAEGVIGLCQARREADSDPRAAKVTYHARARAAVDSTTRALQASYSLQATTLSKAAERVDADLTADPPRPSLADNLGLLAGAMRESLARLGIVTPVCER